MNYGYLLSAVLLIAAIASPLSMNNAIAASKVVCTGTPFLMPVEDVFTFQQSGNSFVIGFEAAGGMTTFDCTDDSHPLEGQTVEVSQTAILGFKPSDALTITTGQVKGKTALALTGSDGGLADVTLEGQIRGTGECDERGICTLTFDIRASSRSGDILTATEIVTVDTNTGRVTENEFQNPIIFDYDSLVNLLSASLSSH